MRARGIMTSSVKHGPRYGNWVSARLVYTLALGAVGLALLTAVTRWLVVPTAVALLALAYFAWARYELSVSGGDVQTKIRGLVLQHLDWDGTGSVLDIGCGSGALVVAAAKRYPEARLTGVDSWGSTWEYSRAVCASNAAIEGVADRVTFRQASASALPFPNGTFDAAISNLTFHEVHDTKDKAQLLKEALRVVRKGGSFAFQDLFLWKRVYGDVPALLESIRSWGVERVEFTDTSGLPFIRRALRLPFMVGTIGILHGRK